MKHSENCLCNECDPVIQTWNNDGMQLTRKKASKLQFTEANAYSVKLFSEQNDFYK